MEIFTARVQAILTLLLVLAFIALLWFKGAEAADALREFVGLAVAFWLMRQRNGHGGQDLQPEKKPDPAPTS